MRRSWSSVLVAFGLLGCVMNNPAFDDARASESNASDSSDATTTAQESGEAGTSTSDSGETGPSETGTSETGTTDTAGDSCDFLARPALHLIVDVPDGGACPASVGELFLRVDPDGFNASPGVVKADACSDSQCTPECTNGTYLVGAPSFPGLIEVWTTLAQLAQGEAVDAVCIEVAAGDLVGEQNGQCVYRSLGIFDRTFEHGPVFIGEVGNAPLTWIGSQALGQLALPSFAGEPLGTCTCASVLEDADDVDCCEASGGEPKFHALSFLGFDVAPGNAKDVPIVQIPWRFYAVQAQIVPSCANPSGDAEISWALARVQ